MYNILHSRSKFNLKQLTVNINNVIKFHLYNMTTYDSEAYLYI